jgi:hypothetical protein
MLAVPGLLIDSRQDCLDFWGIARENGRRELANGVRIATKVLLPADTAGAP